MSSKPLESLVCPDTRRRAARRRLTLAAVASATCWLTACAWPVSASASSLVAVPPAVPAPSATPTRLRSTNYPALVVRAIGGLGMLAAPQGLGDALFVPRAGLADPSCVSLEARNAPGWYLRHQNFRIVLQPFDGSGIFRSDATWCPEPGLSGTGVSLRSLNYPGHYMRHRNYELWLDQFEPVSPLYRADASFTTETPR